MIEGYQYFEMLSLFVAIFCYKGLSHFRIVMFIPLLLLTNIVEMIGSNFRYFGWTNNYLIYNIFIIISIPIYFSLYANMLAIRRNERNILIVIAILSMSFVLVNFFFLQGRLFFNNISLILLEILNIVFSCFVLLRLAFQREIKRGLSREPYFWVCAPILLFSLLTLVLLGLQQYIRSRHIEIGQTSLYRVVLPVANIILYSSYSYAFVLCRTLTNKSSLSS
ncbi:hypothetical protein [Chitinophaga eiseniae]|uniref:Uncharacterized protein n=1 Tax=Chitinophaga eiseniae TaxID=634771 RepID=A0A847SGX0_9BACT|nr:hypothetical protein [Chitinophaga eiseniae]NLR82510.1 hypothetical protein [Chitinophaga eiseniae]